jgi:hypothetical protein
MIALLGSIVLKVVKAYAWKIADDILDEIIKEATNGKEPESKSNCD